MITWYQEAITRIEKNMRNSRAIALDVGTGLGFFAVQLSKIANIEVFAIDVNVGNLKVASNTSKNNSKTAVHWIAADGGVLPFGDGTFDIVTSSFSLQYWENPIGVFNEISRVMRKDGFFLITDLRSDMSPTTMKQIASLSAAGNKADPKDVEKFLKIRLSHCYTPKEVFRMAKKSKLRNWRVTSKPYGFYLESLPKY